MFECFNMFQIRPIVSPTSDQLNTHMVMIRNDIPSAEMEFDFDRMGGFPVAIGGKYSYTIAFTNLIPQVVYLEIDGIEKYIGYSFNINKPLKQEITEI